MLNSEIKIFKDGSDWCAVRPDFFINIQESNAGFGDTPQAALADLLKTEVVCLPHK